jgi:hypothetical protein
VYILEEEEEEGFYSHPIEHTREGEGKLGRERRRQKEGSKKRTDTTELLWSGVLTYTVYVSPESLCRAQDPPAWTLRA